MAILQNNFGNNVKHHKTAKKEVKKYKYLDNSDRITIQLIKKLKHNIQQKQDQKHVQESKEQGNLNNQGQLIKKILRLDS